MLIARQGTSSGSVTGATLTIPHTVSGTSRMLFVMPNEDAVGLTATRITGVTYNGVAMTKLAETYRTFSSGFVQTIWGLAAPDVGTHDIVISLSASDGVSSQNASFTGCDQTLPTGNALKTFSSNANATCSFSPVSITDNSWAIARCIGLDGATVNGTNFIGYGFSNNSGGDSNAGLGTAGTETVDATQNGGGVRWGGCVCAVFAPFSGTASLGISEDLSSSIRESLGRIWSALRAYLEPVGLQSEGTTRAWSLSRGLPTDFLTITESMNSFKGRIIDIIETLGIVERFSRIVNYSRSLSERPGIIETVVRVFVRTVSLIENFIITETISISKVLAIVITNVVSIIEYVRFPLNWLKRTKPTTTWTPRTKP